ncbi:MAG: transposase [Desulfobaccales bacterium]
MSQSKKAANEQRANERARKRGQRSASRKNRSYLAWRHLTRDQKEVAKRIMAGDYRTIDWAGWGFLDKFVIFLKTIGFLECLDVAGEGYVRRMITIAKLLLTYQIKILMGIGSMNQVPQLLFGDIGLLMMLGYTAEQIKNGHCNRGKGKKTGPMHKDTLADALDRFSPVEIEHILNSGVKLLAKEGFIKDSTYLMDATDLPTTEKCLGAGRRTVTKQVVGRDKETGEKRIVEVLETTHGFKLHILRGLDSRIVVAAKVTQIQESEKNWTMPLIHQATENLGGRKIRLLLIDRGYIDGLTLWTLKYELGIDWIIPVRTDMAVTKDARGMRDTEDPKRIFRAQREGLKVVGFKDLRSYDQYGDAAHQQKNAQAKDFKANPINAVMVTHWGTKEYPPGKEKVFLTSLAVSDPLKIIDKYDLRSLIENTTFRELKQGWLINKIPKKTERAVTAHALLTLCMYNFTNAYRTDKGQDLAEQGFRRHRLKTFAQTRTKVVVMTEEHFGIFDLEELAILWGKPPKSFRPFSDVDPEAFKKEHGIE